VNINIVVNGPVTVTNEQPKGLTTMKFDIMRTFAIPSFQEVRLPADRSFPNAWIKTLHEALKSPPFPEAQWIDIAALQAVLKKAPTIDKANLDDAAASARSLCEKELQLMYAQYTLKVVKNAYREVQGGHEVHSWLFVGGNPFYIDLSKDGVDLRAWVSIVLHLEQV